MNETKELENVSQSDSQDYIALNDSQSSIDSGILSDSLLEKYWQHASRNNHQNSWNNRRFSSNYRNAPYNSPQHNAHSRSFSVYESYQRKQFSGSSKPFNSSFNCSHSRSGYDFNPTRNKNHKSFNIMDYLHPSFMEDPWAKLEDKSINEEVSDTDTEDGNASTNLLQSES